MAVGSKVGDGISVAVIVGSGVIVGGVSVGVDVGTGGTDVEAGAHPLNKMVRNANARKTDPIDFFMTYILLI